MMESCGDRMYRLASLLFPICRSITGEGFRKSLNIIRSAGLEDIRVCNIPTGTQVFDWKIPKEWNIEGGGIYKLNGEKIIDFCDSNLHIMGYSVPIDRIVSKEDLLKHIYTQPEQPEWIPYVTSYYKERWGFCMSESQKQTLDEEKYHVVVKSSLTDGALTYGELVIPGESEDEIFFSTYLCHPSMANNELSGPVVQSELIKYVKRLTNRRFTYRFVFIPETIGSLTYCSQNLALLQQRVKAGFVLSCVGDERTYSLIESKYGDSLADKVLMNILRYHYPSYKHYSFLQRGSDERQYNSVGVELPVCGFCRSKYNEYPEYHTSADNMDLISASGLQGSYEVMIKVIEALENNYYYRMTCKGEPQLGTRGLYPTISQKGSYDNIKAMTHFIAYADGNNNLIEISNRIGYPVDVLLPIIERLKEFDLIEVI